MKVTNTDENQLTGEHRMDCIKFISTKREVAMQKTDAVLNTNMLNNIHVTYSSLATVQATGDT